jgi:hypothetical protein
MAAMARVLPSQDCVIFCKIGVDNCKFRRGVGVPLLGSAGIGCPDEAASRFRIACSYCALFRELICKGRRKSCSFGMGGLGFFLSAKI